jgi:uncharacterized protein
MATSKPEDASHGMEFLYGLNRPNVATSLAQCAWILFANPSSAFEPEPEYKSLRQMQLANALCRYTELAKLTEIPSDSISTWF